MELHGHLQTVILAINPMMDMYITFAQKIAMPQPDNI